MVKNNKFTRRIRAVFGCMLAYAVCAGNGIAPDLYRASTIPPALTAGSKAVVRYDNKVFTVKSRNRASLRVHLIITVLKPEGRSFGELPLFYDQFVSIDDVDGALYDADGNEIRTLSSRDTKDYPVDIGATLYTDYRARVSTLYYNSYPYTVEYEYKLNFIGYTNWPSWMPEEEDAAVEQSRFEVRLPGDMPIRYRTTMNLQPEITVDGNEKVYVWKASNLPAFEPEPVGPRTVDQYSALEIAPTLFEIDGYEGDFGTWESFGRWYRDLSENRQALPESVLKQVETIIGGAADAREKVERLYRHMQATTRYVNVTLGVGGWQPYDAQYVSERGYGDCKALSNYMISLLKAAEIRAYPVLIYSGTKPGPVRRDFPSSKFNHVMVCVPLESDTLWLECTSQTLPAGHISYRTEHRPALLITPQGGVLVTTPALPSGRNCQIRKAAVSLVWNGNATADIETEYTGYQREELNGIFQDLTPKEKDDWIRERIQIPAFAVQKSDFSGIDTPSGDGKVRLTLALPRYCSVSGNRLLFQPNLMTRRTVVPKACPSRRQPVILSYAYLDIDTITYTLPEGFTIEALPDPIVIEKQFARYSSSVTTTVSNTVRYVRRLEMNETELPPERYEEFRMFLRDIVQADRGMAAIVQGR